MKERLLFLILFGIFFFELISAIPYILFVDPTPVDNYETTSNNFEINSSIINLSALEEFIFNWDGTNYTFYNDSLVLMMNFENNSILGENDSFVRDLSKYENNGSINDAIFNIAGKYGSTYNFSGKEKITIANSESLNITNNLTISLWIKRENINIKNISTGGLHTCILTERGDIYCWGDNAFGELGTGDIISSPLPKLVVGGHNFTSISAGFCHTCAINTTGSAFCWGYNGEGTCEYGEIGPGELGNGNATNMNTPQLVVGGHNFTSISAGYYYTCAINTTGSAFCWGYNIAGELGIGNTTNMSTPQLVLGGHNFISISSGTNHHQHTCALNTTGSAFCWGKNLNGQLGNGNATSPLPTPQLVLGGYNFTFISSSSSNTCAINTTGSAFCWGRGDYGTLGNGNTTTMNTPQLVIGDLNFTSLASAEHTLCGITTTRNTYCWGYNAYGQLGLGVGNNTNMFVPQLVVGGNNFSEISAFRYHNCGKTLDNNIYCWGQNIFGQLGAGFTEGVYQKPILGKYNFSSISAGKYQTCALNTTGSAFCWGNNEYGQLGNGNTTHMFTPQLVLGGYNFSSISSGYYHNCALTEEGNAYCWGYNFYGELGIGNVTNMNAPQLVLGGNNFTSISTGYQSTCALNTTGSAFCWGNNEYGALGIGNTTNMSTPQLVLGGNNFTSISTGYQSTCALNTTGSAFCWGNNNNKQLGLGNANTTNMYTPQNISGGYNFSKISLYYYSVCALNTTGGAFCWGYNAYGQLGIVNTTNYGTPQLVVGGHNFTSISTGYIHTCGVDISGNAYCWGYNNFGELGIGNTTSTTPTTTFYFPQLVLGGTNFSSITLGGYHTCGVDLSGNAYCWGRNLYGQLGNGRVDPYFPSYKTIKSVLIGKSIDSFLIGESFGGTIIGVLNQNPVEFGTPSSSSWENILLSYNQTADLYLNGILVNNSAYIQINSDPSDIIIGENFYGAIDEVRILNRTLLHSEVQQLQKSNFKKVNETSWEFYSIQNLDSEKTYTYSLFARDLDSIYNLVRNIIKSSDDDGGNGGGSNGGDEKISSEEEVNETVFKPTYNQIQRGYEEFFREDNLIQINLSSKGIYLIKIEKVDKGLENVTILFNGNNYSVLTNWTLKMNVNNDSYYDLQISVRNITTTNSTRLNFKQINEEIPQEKKEPVKENIEIENNVITNKKNKTFYYVVCGFIILGAIVFVFMKFKRHKRYKKFGY